MCYGSLNLRSERTERKQAHIVLVVSERVLSQLKEYVVLR